MNKRTRLTRGLMDNIWLLYNKGVSKTDIVRLLHISIASVSRVIKAFEIASNGIVVSNDDEFKSCKHIAEYANIKFGLHEHAISENETTSNDILKDILNSLEQITSLLKKLV